ncbi:MAG: alpha/beta hydrolase [Bacteroidetes bacterium]|nr:alpha/beta hydrolase [Bacteroidota bacterium]
MYDEGIIDFGDYQIKFYKCGEGTKTLVFLHGLANASQVWFPLIESLSTQYTCITFDWPGCGFSSKTKANYDADFYLGVIKNIYSHFELRQPTLVGHSMGAQWATHWAIQHSEKVDQLHLIAPAGFEIYTFSEQQMLFNSHSFLTPFINELDLLKEGIRSSFYSQGNASSLYQKLFNDIYKDSNTQFLKDLSLKSMKSMMNDPLLPVANQIKNKTSIYFGANDMLIPNKLIHFTTTQAIAEKAEKSITDSKLYMFEKSGHFIHIEQSEAIAKIISASY